MIKMEIKIENRAREERHDWIGRVECACGVRMTHIEVAIGREIELSRHIHSNIKMTTTITLQVENAMGT